jgi:hypothetical protein
MELEHINFEEEPLSREDLLRIKGGASAMNTLYVTGNCSQSSTVSDCDDVYLD